MIALCVIGWVLLGLIGSGLLIYEQGYCLVFDLGMGVFMSLFGLITLVSTLVVIFLKHSDGVLWEKAK